MQHHLKSIVTPNNYMVFLHPVGSHRGTAPFIAWHPLSWCQRKEAKVQVGVVKISRYLIGSDLELLLHVPN